MAPALPLPTMRSTRTLARTALGTTLFLIMLGGYTRGSGSGYGCADRWPLCENGLLGGLLPRLEYHMVIEWTHRWVAAIVGLLIVATAWRAWRDRPRNPFAVWPAGAVRSAVPRKISVCLPETSAMPPLPPRGPPRADTWPA